MQKGAVDEGQVALEEVQDSMSETEHSERLGACKKKDTHKNKKAKDPPKKGVQPPKESSPPFNPLEERPHGLYPVKELKALNLDSSESSSPGTSDTETLDSEEEAELDEEAAKYEEERYYPDERGINKKLPRTSHP